jgi:hypothetical protein
MLIRIQEKFSASIVRNFSVEAFIVSNIIWLVLERMLSQTVSTRRCKEDDFECFGEKSRSN